MRFYGWINSHQHEHHPIDFPRLLSRLHPRPSAGVAAGGVAGGELDNLDVPDAACFESC